MSCYVWMIPDIVVRQTLIVRLWKTHTFTVMFDCKKAVREYIIE